ncbi:MAG: DUF72 domain-containing protein [Armatimonadetes bacterium]|nr:DUF72 domain-containing protein [Armatimonadota bacterium]
MSSEIKVGCCGFPTSQRKYYSIFEVVEIQHTFYQPPQLYTAVKWREEAPKKFEFTLKAWQLITHEPSSPTYRRLRLELPKDRLNFYGSFKPTKEVWDAWLITKDFAEALGAKVVVFQCPASFKPTNENKRNIIQFFERISGLGFVFAWEPRGSWTDEDISEICQKAGLVHCVDPLQREPLTSGMFYFRLHGVGGYKHKYTDFELARLAKICIKHGYGYCMFNNAYMLDDAQRFISLILSR